MRDTTDDMQPGGQGASGDGSESLLTDLERFVERRLMESWFPGSQPSGEDLANWLEIAELDTQVFLRALFDFMDERTYPRTEA